MAIFSCAASLAHMESYAREFFLNRTGSFVHVCRYLRSLVMFSYRFFAFHLSPFWIHLFYFVSLAFVGSLTLTMLKPSDPSFNPKFVDMLFMSTSALTVSGLNTVEMEVFSSSQIVVLTLLMFLGGEVFTSLLGLLLRVKPSEQENINNRANSVSIELGSINPMNSIDHIESGFSTDTLPISKDLNHSSIRYIGFVILGYVVLIHVSGSLLIFLYLTLVSSARDVLRGKKIHVLLFSVSVTVSSFANGGLILTNENMVVFKKNSGLLLLVIPQILAGNTLFPLFLRLILWALRKFTVRAEWDHMMKNPNEIQFCHLLPSLQTAFLLLTVTGLIVVQVVLFCSMDWNSGVFDGLNSYQKVVNALFMAVNARHAGEGTVDLSIVSAAVLVLFLVMMYLPACASFLPIEKDDASLGRDTKENKTKRPLLQNLIFSQASYIVVFIMAICITERRKLSKDPLNFTVMNIIFEVTSAYGNVGFSTGYSCGRLLHPNGNCKDKWYSFSGWWSDEGKLILAFVMLFGRLKKFNMKGGKAWKLI